MTNAQSGTAASSSQPTTQQSQAQDDAAQTSPSSSSKVFTRDTNYRIMADGQAYFTDYRKAQTGVSELDEHARLVEALMSGTALQCWADDGIGSSVTRSLEPTIINTRQLDQVRVLV